MTALIFIHVGLSFIGIVTGIIVLCGLLTGKRLDAWTAIFLVTTVATSATGFLFPFHEFLPSHGIGVTSLILLMIAILARYRFQLAGGWCRTYVISAMIALYLNVFILVVQLFEKVPALRAMAPTQSESPFMATQIVVLATFGVLTMEASMKFRDKSAPTT